jgi:hypothetical protein
MMIDSEMCNFLSIPLVLVFRTRLLVLFIVIVILLTLDRVPVSSEVSPLTLICTRKQERSVQSTSPQK